MSEIADLIETQLELIRIEKEKLHRVAGIVNIELQSSPESVKTPKPSPRRATRPPREDSSSEAPDYAAPKKTVPDEEQNVTENEADVPVPDLHPRFGEIASPDPIPDPPESVKREGAPFPFVLLTEDEMKESYISFRDTDGPQKIANIVYSKGKASKSELSFYTTASPTKLDESVSFLKKAGVIHVERNIVYPTRPGQETTLMDLDPLRLEDLEASEESPETPDSSDRVSGDATEETGDVSSVSESSPEVAEENLEAGTVDHPEPETKNVEDGVTHEPEAEPVQDEPDPKDAQGEADDPETGSGPESESVSSESEVDEDDPESEDSSPENEEDDVEDSEDPVVSESSLFGVPGREVQPPIESEDADPWDTPDESFSDDDYVRDIKPS